MQPMLLKISDIPEYNLKSHCEMSSLVTHRDKATALCWATDSPSMGSAFSAIQEMQKFKIFTQFFLNVCDRTKENNDCCSMCANGKISTSLTLLVFISVLAKCF